MMKKYGGQIAVGTYFVIYCLATVLQSQLWGDILAPWGSLIAAAVLFYVYKNSVRLKLIWLLLSAGCLCFGLADVGWAVSDLVLGIDPEEQPHIMWGYMVTNFILAIVAGMYLSSIAAKLSKMQLLLDVTAISASALIFFWLVFTQADFIGFFRPDNALLALSMATDFFVLVAMAVWMLSVRIKALTGSCYLALAGVIVYTLIDLVWSYLYFYDRYVPNTPVDALYILGLLLLALGGLLSLKQNTPWWAEAFYAETDYVGSRRKGALLLLLPILLVAVDGWDYQQFAWLLSIFMIHQILSSFVQNAVKTEQLRFNEAYIEQSKQLELIANQDALTNLSNRRRFMERLADAGENYRQNGNGFAVVFLDIDGFKLINDTYGHDVGDLLLVEIARLFSASIRKKDTLARLGGDEFVLLFADLNDELELKGIVRRLRNIFAEPIMINNAICSVGVSIGVGKCPDDSREGEELLKIADKKMYKEKMSRKFRAYQAN